MTVDVGPGDLVEITSFHPKLNGRMASVVGTFTRQFEHYIRVQILDLSGRPEGSYHVPARCVVKTRKR